MTPRALLPYLKGLVRDGPARVGVRIFMYHGLTEAKDDVRLERNLHLTSVFREQLAFLRQQRVLALAELHDLLAEGRPLPSRAAVVTFDDGYRNSLVAAEMLRRAGIPWTLFVPTAAVGEGGTIWTVEISLLILRGEARSLKWRGEDLSLDGSDARDAAFQRIRTDMKALATGEQQTSLAELRAQFPSGELARLLERFPAFRILSWEELKQLSSDGVEIGSHGVNHAIHHPAQPAETRLHELTESRDELERRLGRSCRFFAYPNGDSLPESPDELRRAGYLLGLTTMPGTVRSESDPTQLPRIYSPGTREGLVRRFYWAPRP